MDEGLILSLVKAELGISSTVRDAYIAQIIKGVIDELIDEKGLVLNGANSNHLMFVVDYASWRYKSKDSDGSMPRHLKYRLNNLFISARGESI